MTEQDEMITPEQGWSVDQGLLPVRLATGSISASSIGVLDADGDKVWDIQVSEDRQSLKVMRADGQILSVVPQCANVVWLELR